jgi:sialate O-acetylesterase
MSNHYLLHSRRPHVLFNAAFKVKRATLMAAFTLGIASLSHADVVLPKVIDSHMILQRGAAVPVWGWADQGEAVTVEFAGQSKTATPDASGKWMVKLDPLNASAESRVMTIAGNNTLLLEDVLVGEVWLASGQSNMEWSLAQVAQAEQVFAATQQSNRLVRAFHVDQHLSSGIPLDDTSGRWKNCAEILQPPMRSVSAVGFFFALKLQQELGVPVAILDANWGGQRIECFIPDEGYKALGLNYRKRGGSADPKVIAARARQAVAALGQVAAAADKGIKMAFAAPDLYGNSENFIYNAMIAPLTPYAIKGAIWYQGESNRGANDYFKKLQALSAGWSQVFNVTDIPLYQVQIAPFDYNRGQNPKDSKLCETIWTAQYQGAAEISGMGIVAIHDTNIDIKNIHPVEKRPVGERLAAQALKNQYAKEVVATSPSVAGAKLAGATVVVSFKDVDQGLSTSDGQTPSWFELSADGEVFVAADAVIRGNTVEVSAAAVPVAKFVRMGWADIAIPNLSDKNGWPVFAFAAQSVN